MKTTNEVLTAVAAVVEGTGIALLDGGVYKKTRPTSSSKQDCVINIIAGATGKFIQDGAVYVKLFYADVQQLNSFFEDSVTGQSMEILLQSLSTELLNMNGYSYEVSSREIYTAPMLETDEHYAILKINFKLTVN